MSAMFEYITGKKEGKVPQLEASLEHALGLLGAEIDDGVKYRAEIERLRAALEKYGMHLADCELNDPSFETCICGLKDFNALTRGTMSTITLDAYKDWTTDKLKQRCRELVRATIDKDIIIAVLAKCGIDELSPADRMEVDRICSQWDD